MAHKTFIVLTILFAGCSRPTIDRTTVQAEQSDVSANPLQKEEISESCAPQPVTGSNLAMKLLPTRCDGRTVDEGDGGAGFLVNPQLVSINEIKVSGSTPYLIKGSAGSVRPAEGTAKNNLLVAAFQPSADQMNRLLANKDKEITLEGISIIAGFYANSDGSFFFNGELHLGPTPLVVAITRKINKKTGTISLYQNEWQFVYMSTTAVGGTFAWPVTTVRTWHDPMAADFLKFSDNVPLQNAEFSRKWFLTQNQGNALLFFNASIDAAGTYNMRSIYLAEMKTGQWSFPKSTVPFASGGTPLFLTGTFSVATSPNGNVIAAWIDNGKIFYRFRKNGSWTTASNGGFDTLGTDLSQIKAGISDTGNAMLVFNYQGRLYLASFNGTSWNYNLSSPMLATVGGTLGNIEFSMGRNDDYLLVALCFGTAASSQGKLYYQSSKNGVVSSSAHAVDSIGNYDAVQVYDLAVNSSGQAILGVALPSINHACYFDGHSWTQCQKVSVSAARPIFASISPMGEGLVTWTEVGSGLIYQKAFYHNGQWDIPQNAPGGFGLGANSIWQNAGPYSGIDAYGHAFIFWSMAQPEQTSATLRTYSGEYKDGSWNFPAGGDYIQPKDTATQLLSSSVSDDGYAAMIYQVNRTEGARFYIREYK